MESIGELRTTKTITTSDTTDEVTDVIRDFNMEHAREGASYIDMVIGYLNLYLNIISIFILTMFAIGTNIVNMMVLVKQGINTCVSLCLFCLAATDFLSTLAGLCSQPSKIMMFLNIRPGFDPFAFYFFMVYMSAILYDVSNTLTAFLSLERCLCVCLPLQFKDIFTFWRGVAVIVCIYLLCFGLLLPHFLSSGLEMRTSRNSTFLALWLSPDRAAVDVYVDAVHFCQTAVVTTTVFVCTLLMIVSLNRSSKFQGGKSNEFPVTFSGKNTNNSCVAQTKSEDFAQPSESKAADKTSQSGTKSGNTVKSLNNGRNTSATSNNKSAHSSRNLNVIKTVIVLCVICFVCNLSRLALATASHIDPRFRLNKEHGKWYQIFLSICYVFQLLNCSLNIFVYYRFNQSFRKALLNSLFWKSEK
ncbi:hypothetical protein RRG08_058379 [Elysia crispata]|uniref:G-protein coupled receptors family 1 profile domain-containing protein n=1 Tax=Elysia crispata TaxID=231223 RepID=A0AAE0XWB3_9GAST|nr:hypothetical protein RRG08_058379 [Elysia crispata]